MKNGSNFIPNVVRSFGHFLGQPINDPTWSSP